MNNVVSQSPLNFRSGTVILQLRLRNIPSASMPNLGEFSVREILASEAVVVLLQLQSILAQSLGDCIISSGWTRI